MSQLKDIVSYLQPPGRTLTQLKALKLFGCMRLASRVNEWNRKRRVKIKSKIVTKNKKRFAEYYFN